jgi:hypothetical protein
VDVGDLVRPLIQDEMEMQVGVDGLPQDPVNRFGTLKLLERRKMATQVTLPSSDGEVIRTDLSDDSVLQGFPLTFEMPTRARRAQFRAELS